MGGRGRFAESPGGARHAPVSQGGPRRGAPQVPRASQSRAVGGVPARAGLSRRFSGERLPRHVRISGFLTGTTSVRKVGYVVIMNNRHLL